MKHLLLFLIAGTLLSAKAQTDSHVYLSTTFDGSSSGSDEDFIIAAPGGENLVATTITDGASQVLNIKRVALNGAVSTVTNIILPSSQYSIQDMAVEPGGSFLVCLKHFPELSLMKFTSAGAIVWQKSLSFNPIPVNMNYFSGGIDVSPAGGYFFSINSWECLGIIKMDNSGNPLWSHRIVGPYTDSVNTVDSTWSLDKCPGFNTTCTDSGGCVSTIKDDSYEGIVNLDGDGNLIWSRSFIGTTYRWPRCIEQDGAGNFVILGTEGSVNSYIHKLDANGNIVFGKMVAMDIIFQDMDFDAAGNIYAIGTTFWSGPTRMAKFNLNGDYIWSQSSPTLLIASTTNTRPHFSKNEGSEVSFLTRTSGGNYVVTKFSGDTTELCGFDAYPNPEVTQDNSFFAAEVNENLLMETLNFSITPAAFSTTTTEYYTSSQFCSMTSVADQVKEDKLNVFPNPSSGSVSVQIAYDSEYDVLLRVFDVQGRQVASKQITGKSTTVAIEGLASGLYNIVLSEAGTVLSQKRLIIQK